MNDVAKQNMIIVAFIGFVSTFIGFYAANTYVGLFMAFVSVLTLALFYPGKEEVQNRE